MVDEVESNFYFSPDSCTREKREENCLLHAHGYEGIKNDIM